eukprot:403369733
MVKVSITQEKYCRVPVMVPVNIHSCECPYYQQQFESSHCLQNLKSTIFLNTRELVFSSVSLLSFGQIKRNLENAFGQLENFSNSDKNLQWIDPLDRIVFKTMKVAGINCVQITNKSNFDVKIFALKRLIDSQDMQCNCHIKLHDPNTCQIVSKKVLSPGKSIITYSTHITLLKIPSISNIHEYKLTFETFTESDLVKILNSLRNTCTNIQARQSILGKRKRSNIDSDEKLETQFRDVKRQKISHESLINSQESLSGNTCLQDFLNQKDFVDQLEPSEEQICSICCERLKEQSITSIIGPYSNPFCCTHLFCFDCIFNWVSDKCSQCPLCRVSDQIEIRQFTQNPTDPNDVEEDQMFIEEFFNKRNGNGELPDFVVERQTQRSRSLYEYYYSDSDSSESDYSSYTPTYSQNLNESIQIQENTQLQENLFDLPIKDFVKKICRQLLLLDIQILTELQIETVDLRQLFVENIMKPFSNIFKNEYSLIDVHETIFKILDESEEFKRTGFNEQLDVSTIDNDNNTHIEGGDTRLSQLMQNGTNLIDSALYEKLKKMFLRNYSISSQEKLLEIGQVQVQNLLPDQQIQPNMIIKDQDYTRDEHLIGCCQDFENLTDNSHEETDSVKETSQQDYQQMNQQ